MVTERKTESEEPSYLNTANTENSPRKRKLKILIEKKSNMIKHQKLKIKRLQTTMRRYKRKISAMKDLLDELKQNRYINADHHSLLTDSDAGVKDN
ncbi:unnamed protein product [Euphydryas editha]|uniref:Uncharacterized protein n=1 Tax=Euphydryas editha TaxID=104508 RepID=A0AAU9U0T1_EUPED|nr:unnamed protein product [Euphydryas editha]